MTWNAKRQFLEAGQVFVDTQQRLPGWPGFVDASLVMPSMLLTTGLLGAFAIACDMVPNRVWRLRLWVTLAGTGFSIVILGLAQRLTDAPSIFWDLEQNVGHTFFAVFRYHANAGSFINLMLPLMAGLAVRAFLQETSHASRAIWSFATLVTAAAGFVNVSRAANVVCALLLVGMCLCAGLAALQNKNHEPPRTPWLIAGAVIATAVILAFSFGIEKTTSRWEMGSWQILRGDAGRAEARQIMMHSAIPSAGALGFGPGTFEPMFDIHRAQSGSKLEGRWDKGHSDPLQTLMEWGWVGSCLWVVLLGGAIFRGVITATKRRSNDPDANILATVFVFSLSSVIIHSAVDFPLQIASLQLITVLVAGILWGEEKG